MLFSSLTVTTNGTKLTIIRDCHTWHRDVPTHALPVLSPQDSMKVSLASCTSRTWLSFPQAKLLPAHVLNDLGNIFSIAHELWDITVGQKPWNHLYLFPKFLEKIHQLGLQQHESICQLYGPHSQLQPPS
jgi:hypothetical protein